VALQDPRELRRPSKATELLRKTALVSGGSSQLDEILPVVEEATAWLEEHQDDEEVSTGLCEDSSDAPYFTNSGLSILTFIITVRAVVSSPSFRVGWSAQL